ncbi:MAG: AarF/ABC1/UbiB kinase family protein, partial [Deltaproteobacteria bacterium]|nr:AarF/ABC1/UbiB kinase family protein [Deltaproteobacteria bacterium]
YNQIREQIKKELGKYPEEIFVEFSKEPIASASLGQVHTGITPEGKKVAIKVRHLDVEMTSSADLKTIWRILRLVKRFVKIQGLDNYYYEIESMIKDELDFEKEAEYIEIISSNFKDSDTVIFPEIYKEYSTSKVLTLGFIDAVKISENNKLIEKGIDLTNLATNLITAYCQMIFVDGIYHADPHPGNMLVTDDGKIVLIDFGAVGVLKPKTKAALGMLMESIIKGDADQLLRALKQMGFLRIGTNQTDAAQRVIEHFHRKFQEEIRVTDFSFSSINIDPSKGFEHLSDIRGMNVGLKELTSAFHIPREWVLLERIVIQLTGICTTLDQHLNPATIVRPYLEEFVLGDERDWSGMMFDLTRDKIFAFLSLPKMFEKYINSALNGNLQVKVDGLNKGFNLLYHGLRQLTFSILTSVFAGGAVYFYHMKQIEFFRYSLGLGLLTIFMIIYSSVKAIKYK